MSKKKNKPSIKLGSIVEFPSIDGEPFYGVVTNHHAETDLYTIIYFGRDMVGLIYPWEISSVIWEPN